MYEVQIVYDVVYKNGYEERSGEMMPVGNTETRVILTNVRKWKISTLDRLQKECNRVRRIEIVALDLWHDDRMIGSLQGDWERSCGC